MTRQVISIVTLAVSATAFASVADTTGIASLEINSRIAAHSGMMWRMASQSFANPAIRQWMLPESYSSLAASYCFRRESEIVDIQRGNGSGFWGVEADSYIKYKTSTLWGTAAYRNGRQRGLNWNESSDADLVYPYFIADSIGGDMHAEIYSFSGGYAGHTDRWAWGAMLAYNAGLHYRNIDPRPRNTTGRLDISVGGAVRVAASDYRAGVSVSYRKYKQSCDIEFVNEMSDNRVWHLTGLGTHYERFAGNGYTHYYNGNRWGISLDLFPQTCRGAVVSLEYASFSFDHILTSLNRLPLQSVADRQMVAMAGWLAPGDVHDWAVIISLRHGKRTGMENIFGDPASGIYPQIGSLDMYTHTLDDVAVNLLYQWRMPGGTLLSAAPSAAYSRSREVYADPRRHLQLGSVTSSVSLQATHGFSRLWRGRLSACYAYSATLGCSSDLPFDCHNPVGMQAVDIRRYEVLSKNHSLLEINADVSRAVSSKYALMLSASYSRGSYSCGINADMADVAISFIF